MTLRARIYAGFGLVLVAFLVVGAVVVATQRSRLIDQLDNQLEAVAPLNLGQTRPPVNGAPPDRGDSNLGEAEAEVVAPLSDLYIAAVADDGSTTVVVRGQLLQTTPVLVADMADATARAFETVDSADGSTRFRVLVDPARVSDDVAVIALPMNDVDDSIAQLTITFALLAGFVAAVLALLAWWIARLGLRPISEMTSTATAIAGGDREHRVEHLDERTEAGQLAVAFNEMLDQRDGAEDRLRRFVSDASHELRTPLTSVMGYLDLYTEGGFRDPGQLDDAVRRMQSEAHRMKGLVENLLALARFDEEQSLQRSSFDLAALIDDVVADSQAAHPDRTIAAAVDDAPLMVSLDRFKVQQLVAGLVTNATVHAPDATIEVRSRSIDHGVEVVVADDGPGLTSEQAEQVFERFYRGDPARARSSGGSGLGLAIAKSIAVAHGGTIDVRTSPGAGCEFTVRFLTDD